MMHPTGNSTTMHTHQTGNNAIMNTHQTDNKQQPTHQIGNKIMLTYRIYEFQFIQIKNPTMNQSHNLNNNSQTFF